MTAVEYAGVLRRRWWLLVALGLVGAGAGLGLSLMVPPRYYATATLLVDQRADDRIVQLNDLQASERLANTYSRLIVLHPILEQASAALGGVPSAEALEDRVAVRNPRGTQLLEVRAWDGDPETAGAIANTVAGVFIADNASAAGGRTGVVSIVEPARPPRRPSWPRTPLNAGLGAGAGLILALGLALVRESLDDRIRNPADLERETALPLLGTVPGFRVRRPAPESLQVALAPTSRVAEAYRGLRTAVTQALARLDGARLVLVTTPRTGAGASTTVANLAVAYGLSGRRAVVVDAHLRDGTQHEMFGPATALGLSALLRAREDLDAGRAVQSTAHPGVFLVAAGEAAPNPSELLGSARMAKALAGLRARFDLVLLDAPPALEHTDAAVLAALVDATVVVARAGETRGADVRAAAALLARAGKPVLGVVLNRAG